MGYRPSCSQKEGQKKAYFWVFQCIFHCLLPTKAWQRNQVGNQTADQWNRERWAKRTQRTSPKYERWRPQTATGDTSEQQLHVWCLLNASLSLRHESFCAQQASLTVQRSGSGCPAALFIQFGGGAREGGAAAREPAPYQCVLPLHILRRRCLGPKVKTIPSCTSLPAHFCTVAFTLLFWLVFFSFLFFVFFCCWALIPWRFFLHTLGFWAPVQRTRWVQWRFEVMFVCVCDFFHEQCPPSAAVCQLFVSPRSR